VSDDLPEPYLEKAAHFGIQDRELRTGKPATSQERDDGVRSEMERVVRYLKETVFPIVVR
jgi:hypothetical protein